MSLAMASGPATGGSSDLSSGARQATTSSITCPPEIKSTETAEAQGPQGPQGPPGPQGAWRSEPSTKVARFERISVFNEQQGRRFDLAPDTQKRRGTQVTQVWTLRAYRSLPVFLQCRYHGTEASLITQVPDGIERCTLQFSMGARGRVSGASSMICR
jgi:hypothetical protein